MMLDRNPEEKRKYFASKLSKVSDKLVQRMDEEAKCIDKFIESLDKSLQKSRLIFITPDDWLVIIEKAFERDVADCPICMCALEDGSDRDCVITSCTHVFHAQCLNSFENFDSFKDPVCPCCRQPYQKKSFSEL